MTTIRKIVTSKIDGDSANNTNTSEIRPSNETAFYLDTSGNTDKLTLMMFDGVRTHLKSKVLAPGRLYGSDADAGDNSGSDTIKLIPDATLHYNGSDQYLIIDPTGGEPGHIHIRAGGTQDSSGADLYLGGELTCVRVSDTSDSVTIRTTNIGDPNITMDWSFQPDGNLYFPGIGNNRIGESEPGLVVSSDNSVVLQSNNTGESAEWYFGADGNLTLPNSITMGPGSSRLISVVTPAPGLVSWEFGMDGNLTVPGNINYANGVSILSGLGGADFSNVSLIGTAGNLTIQAPSPSNTATVTNENGTPGGPGSNTIAAQSLYSPGIGLVQPGWTVTGNNLTSLTTVTNVSGPDEFGAYTITTDTTETDPFWYNDVYTFTNNVISYSNLVISSGNIIGGTSQINFVANSSGDGNGYSTIQIRPDAELYTDQYIIVDPTGGEPGHIHLRAGGTQDASGADLYLGGELTAVRVSDTSGIVTVRTTNIGDPNITMDWSFQPDGNLYFPGIGNNRIGESEPGLVVTSDNSVVLQANNSGNINEIREWTFGADGDLSLPTGGSLIFDSSATSTIDGVTNISASGTIGANVIQVLSDLTSFGASPAPVIYGFRSISTTGSAVNEGNISASGNLVASQNAYVTGNIFAASYNFANGVNILDTISGVTSISSVVNTSILSDVSGDYQYGTLDYSYAVNGNNGQFAIQYSFPLVYGNVDVNVGNVIASNVTTTNGIFWANGQAYSTGGGSYGNTEVAAYLPAYTGNLGAGRAQVTNAVDFMYGGFPYMGWQLSGSDTLKLRTNIASGDYTNDAVIVDRQSLAVNVVATLSAGNIITTSGVFWSNGTAYSTGGGTYGNTEVAAYLPTYTGNIAAGNVNVTSTVYAANIVTSGTSGNISGVNVISANTFVFAANGVNILSVAGGTYGNTEVAAYLLTWPNIDSNILDATSANITTLRANNFSTANAVISGGYISALTNASIISGTITTLNSTGGNITTLRATNFGTANAVITGGYINSLANLTATTAVLTNLSTGNAVISGGYISALTNAYITTSAITNFSTANAVITGGYASGLANVTATGNVTAGNLIGYGSNTSIIAGAYTSTFDNVGNVILPNAYVSGNTTVMGLAPGYAPNRPAFRVYGNGAVPNWHNTANVNLKGSAITVDHNQGNYFDSTTGKFTVPVAGLYITTLQARVGDNNGLNQIAVLKNGNNSGANVVCFWETDTNTGTATHFGTSGVVLLSPGDFLSANILAGNINFDGNDSWTVTYLG